MKNERKILVFGNPLIKKDEISLKLIRKLREIFPKIEFIEMDPTEEIQKYGREIIIIDAVENVRKVTLIDFFSSEDFEKIKLNNNYSLHDFDLGYNLRLLKKMKLIDRVKIIGIPIKNKENFSELIKETAYLIKKILKFDKSNPIDFKEMCCT